MTRYPLAKLWIMMLIVGSSLALADGSVLHSNGLLQPEPQQKPVNYLGRIELNDPEAVAHALERAEAFHLKQGATEEDYSPVVLVIHGAEVGIFFKQNYQRYKSIVDLAAKLSAFKVVDIRVCETSAHGLGLDVKTVFPFISTVPYGPDEIVRLIDVDKYIYF